MRGPVDWQLVWRDEEGVAAAVSLSQLTKVEAAGSAGQQGWHQRPKLLGAQPIPTSLAQTIPSIVLEFKLLPSLNRGSFRTKALGGTPSTKYISPRRFSGPAFVTNLASEVTVVRGSGGLHVLRNLVFQVSHLVFCSTKVLSIKTPS